MLTDAIDQQESDFFNQVNNNNKKTIDINDQDKFVRYFHTANICKHHLKINMIIQATLGNIQIDEEICSKLQLDLIFFVANKITNALYQMTKKNKLIGSFLYCIKYQEWEKSLLDPRKKRNNNLSLPELIQNQRVSDNLEDARSTLHSQPSSTTMSSNVYFSDIFVGNNIADESMSIVIELSETNDLEDQILSQHFRFIFIFYPFFP